MLGTSWEVSEPTLKDVEEFTCCLYDRKQFQEVDELQFYLLKEKCKKEQVGPILNVDLSVLPPCRRRLEQQEGQLPGSHLEKGSRVLPSCARRY